MAMLSSRGYISNSGIIYGHLLLPILLILFSNIPFQIANCGNIVNFLPGFQGPLPFVLETGYVGVGENEDVQVFYYFIQSENNPKDDPLILWLTGGPGCSSLSAIVFEIGPFLFKEEDNNGILPNIILRPYSWTKTSSIIFVDLPVTTGFTYARTESATRCSDLLTAHNAHEFLRKWLVDHPEFLSNKVYIGGNSYSGIPLPAIVQEISQGNEERLQPFINLQGYLLGNPKTTISDSNYQIPFAHGMGIISDELYKSLQKNCEGENLEVGIKNKLCSSDVESFDKMISGINIHQILEPLCSNNLSPKPSEVSGRRSLLGKHSWKHLTLPSSFCGIRKINLYRWINDENVRNALHIRKGSIGEWIRCHDCKDYKYDIPSSIPYHVNLSRKGYRSLISSGDHDLRIPFLGTQAWIRSLNYSIVDDWRPWLTNGQVAGYTRTYSNGMTFATVKGAGHVAAEDKPEECFIMFNRWISNRPL